MENYAYVKRNYEELTGELTELARSVGTAAPTLVCVTKSGTDEELLALCRAGASDIGENRPGELKRRYELIMAAGMCPRMHEIGTLQRNKVKLIADFASLIHSVDSVRLAADIDRLAERAGRKIPVLIEVNSAREANKSGCLPEEAEGLLCEVLPMRNIEPVGLMTMGPVCDNPEDIRVYFRETKRLLDTLAERYGFGPAPVLSMGMSDSYRVAIEEGATLVRIGRRLFRK